MQFQKLRTAVAKMIPIGPGKRRRTALAAAFSIALLAGSGASAVAIPTAAPAGHGEQRISGLSLRQGNVTVDGATLRYTIAGSGSPLVLLHGWPQTWWSWNKVLPALASQHTVIAFDLPGLGASTPPASGYDKATTAKRIRQGVNQLGYRQVALLGHDVGALVAYAYARDFPTEVTRMGAVETPLSGFGLENLYGVSWHFLFNASPAPIPERIMDNDDVPTYLGMLFDGARHPEAIDRNVYYRAYADPVKRKAGYEYYRAFAADAADNQANAQSKRLAIPVMAMGAEFVFGPAVAASFQQVASDVRTVVAPDSGHWIPEENAQFFSDCALLFFGPAGGAAPRPELTNCTP
ncbi:alpha/beta hydrolase [Micromonospora sediminicola]|uniref:alpha/beta fold hydrolase n=1 Tax=Micromonospora sediminicola TaxID=946078 RepID=UPI0033C91798